MIQNMPGLHVLFTVLLLLLAQTGSAQQHRRDANPNVRGAPQLSALGQSDPADHAPATAAVGPEGAWSPAGSAVTTAHAHPTAAVILSHAAINAVESARRLSQASQAGLVPATQPAQLPVRYSSGALVPSKALGCPAKRAEVSSGGCPCTVYHDNTASSDSSRATLRRTNLCPAGFRCSPTAAAALAAAGWHRNSSTDGSSSSQLAPLDELVSTESGICTPCALGEWCPIGSQEEDHLSMAACEAQQLAALPSARPQQKPGSRGGRPLRGSSSSSIPAISRGFCTGVKLCPAGSYCPSAAVRRPCEKGRWCPEGSIKSQTCNITGLLVWNPFKKAPGMSELILESLVKAQQPLNGNSCPANASNPLSSCPPGFFCPTPAERLPCPMGFFCPGHTIVPIACPVLGSCMGTTMSTPDWSAMGVLLMLLLLAVLLAVLEYVRVSGRCRRKARSQEEDVLQLIEAVGFKMVETQGTYSVARTSKGQAGDTNPPAQYEQQDSYDPAQGRMLQSSKHALQSSKQAAHRAVRGTLGYFNKPGQPKGVTSTQVTPVGKAAPDHAVVTVKQLPPPSDSRPAAATHRVWFGWLGSKRQPHEQQLNSSTSTKAALQPLQKASQGDKLLLQPLSGSPDTDDDADSVSGEYVINPRLTLVFRDVWVADRPIDEGLLRKAQRRLQGLCCSSASSYDASTSHTSHWAGDDASRVCELSGHSLSTTKQADIFTKLETAAAAGAHFIVPGVSSRFAHSQLHAIMGPSGCGKTTLCKALAGRLPQSRMCGDVRLLCSSAADGYKAEVELTAAGSQGSAAAAFNISNMTGFVPQFDQLHETLTVLENLQLAAKLRLPISRSTTSHGLCCGEEHDQRHRDVHKVVGEVMALMALTKVATTVVGSSSARLLSGGQRKRVAIGVELVSKPSLLWLDEPTSGLDAAVAYDVVAALKASCERGMNVLAVMHQPRCSIFKMFDSCMLLGGDGHVVYCGPQRLALPYMAFLGFYIPPNENIADFLMDITAGVVPRPGDPNYIPSQLGTMWHKAGGLWVYQQQRKEQQLLQSQQQLGGLQHATTLNIMDLLPVPPAVDAHVDWPWRPRDLEALLTRFHLLVDGHRAGAGASRGGASKDTSHSVLSYDGFLAFWDESGVRQLLGEDQYADFVAGLCDEFGIQPDTCITQEHFVDVLKSQLRAAAAASADMAHEGFLTAPEPNTQQDSSYAQITGSGAQVPGSSTAGDAGLKPLARKSAFEAFSDTPLGEEDDVHPPADPCEAVLRSRAAAVAACDAAAAAEEAAAACEQLADQPTWFPNPFLQQHGAGDAVCADAAVADRQAAPASASPAAGAAAGAASGLTTASAAGSCLQTLTSGVGPEVQSAQLSRTCSSVYSYDRPAFAPGVLTCPQARLKQLALRKQFNRLPSGAQRGPSAAAECAQRRQQCQEMQQKQAQALARCKETRKAMAAAAAQQSALRQVSHARMMQSASFSASRPSTAAAAAVAAAGDSNVCSSLQEARTRCLDELGDFLLRQECRGSGPELNPLQHAWPNMCTANSMAPTPEVAASILGAASYALKQPPKPVHAAGSAAVGAAPQRQKSAVNGGAAPDSGTAACQEAAAAAKAAALLGAAAAVSNRRLPSRWKQLQLVMLRSSWKAVLSRSALMTDLLLTSLLGLALGVAQGRDIQPGPSLMWMLITLLAYGCITLVRSTRSYGSERHLYLQLESPAGVSVTSWVFGHQVIDMVGLVLHPLLFFAWMYVLTLTPVPAETYLLTLGLVGFYTSGLGYLVSLLVSPTNTMIAALAAALLLGGVANGVVPNVWTLDATHPLLWIDFISYTRWGLQLLYVSWLTPAPGTHAPATATFLSGLGFCGLDASLLQALSGKNGWGKGMSSGLVVNTSSVDTHQWWNMTSAQRSLALADAAAATLRDSPASSRADIAAATAITQLWRYYHHPHLLNNECKQAQGAAVGALLLMGVLCRLLVWVVVKFKVARKAQE